ncbi:MAG: AgmX/PglI C-terminal domain-containing protein [Myxococcota bacterium]
MAGAAPVSNSTGSGAVASCVAGKVRRWVFPQPKGGGIVVVTYPFVFSAK